jgi:hypothetical protein
MIRFERGDKITGIPEAGSFGNSFNGSIGFFN